MVPRVAAVLLLCGIALLLLVAAWPQLFGLQLLPVLAQVVALRAVAAIAAVVIGVVFVALAVGIRRTRRFCAAVAVLMLAFSIASAAVLVGRGVGGATDAEPVTDDGGLTVLAWNTLGDSPGAQAIADLAIETGADIVSLPETTEATAIETAEIMRDAGRPMWVNHLSVDDIVKARSTSLLTSADLGTYSRDDSRGTTPGVPTVIAVPDSGSGPTIIAAHPVAPIPGYLAQWREGLEFLSEVCAGENVIMAGDLNSTADHYSALGNGAGGTIGDCVDAAMATGSGAVGTWPAELPALLGAPIDHVMATPNWVATSTTVIQDRDGSGSDHRPIVAHLIPAG